MILFSSELVCRVSRRSFFILKRCLVGFSYLVVMEHLSRSCTQCHKRICWDASRSALRLATPSRWTCVRCCATRIEGDKVLCAGCAGLDACSCHQHTDRGTWVPVSTPAARNADVVILDRLMKTQTALDAALRRCQELERVVAALQGRPKTAVVKSMGDETTVDAAPCKEETKRPSSDKKTAGLGSWTLLGSGDLVWREQEQITNRYGFVYLAPIRQAQCSWNDKVARDLAVSGRRGWLVARIRQVHEIMVVIEGHRRSFSPKCALNDVLYLSDQQGALCLLQVDPKSMAPGASLQFGLVASPDKPPSESRLAQRQLWDCFEQTVDLYFLSD